MRSLISTLASTAVPIVSTKPAMPGRVSVAFSSAASRPRMTSTLMTTRQGGVDAEAAIGQHHEGDDQATTAIDRCGDAGVDQIAGTELGARPCVPRSPSASTGSLPERSAIASWLALSTVKLPLIDGAAAQDRFVDVRSRDRDPSMMMANGWPTILLRHLGEAAWSRRR